MQRTVLLLATAVSAIGASAPAAAPARSKPCRSGACAVKKATSLLEGRALLSFDLTGSLVTEQSSIDRRLALCRNGRFAFTTTSSIPEAGTQVATRDEGTWRVVRASFRGRSGRAVLEGIPDATGDPVRVTVTTDGRTVRADGHVVRTERAGC